MKTLRRFLLVNVGLLIMASGLHFFLIPADLAVGGVTGLGMIVRTYVPDVNLGLLMLIFNAVLFAIAFLVVGREFGGYTVYASFALSAMIGGFELIAPQKRLLTDDTLLLLLFGILIQGSGMAIIFYQNASTGGTDIVAKIINKYTQIEIGKALFLSDALITLMAGITFSPTLGMYAFLGVMFNGAVIDKVIAGFETKVHTQIISSRTDEIASFIHGTLDRSMTLLHATGGYTGEDRDVISIVLSPRQYIRLKQYVRSIDPHAFVIMGYVHEVLGEGFDLASPQPR